MSAGHSSDLSRTPTLQASWQDRLFLPTLVAILAVAVVLRALGTPGDLWIDEIWSLHLARSVDSWLAVFTGIHSDNNHWLNTLYLHWIGLTDRFWIYRLPALITGAATVILASWSAVRRGRAAVLITATLFGFSYVLIHLSSEARGYAPAVFFAVAAYLVMDRYLREGTAVLAFVFSVAATLGFLSHLTFLWVYAGLVLWSLVELRRGPRSRRESFWALTQLHALPSVMATVLVLVDIRIWTIEGSDGPGLVTALGELVRWSFGIVDVPALLLLTGLLLGAVAAYELLRMRLENQSKHLFFLCTFLLGPIALALSGPGWYRYRYFVVAVPFLLFLVVRTLERGFRGGGVGRALAVGAMVLFLSGNGLFVHQFLLHGKGQYQAALTHIATETTHSPITVALHGYRARQAEVAVVSFYSQFLPREREIVVLPPNGIEAGLPDWVIVQDSAPDSPAPPPFLVTDDRRFVFDGRFQHWGPSGWSWNLYRSTAEGR